MGFFRDLFFGKPKQIERPLPGIKQPQRTKTPQRRPAAIATPYAREALNKEPPTPKTSQNVNERRHPQSSSMRSNNSHNKSRNDDNDFIAMTAAMVMLDSNDDHQVKHTSDSLDRYSTIVSESRSDSGSHSSSGYSGSYSGGGGSSDTSSSSDGGGGGGCD